MQHSYAENVHRLDVVNGLVTKQRLREQEIGGEQEDYESEQDEYSRRTVGQGRERRIRRRTEYCIRVKLGHFKIHRYGVLYVRVVRIVLYCDRKRTGRMRERTEYGPRVKLSFLWIHQYCIVRAI